MTNKRALLPDQAADVRGHVDQALEHVRAAMNAAAEVGPVLVNGYRALSALRELRDTVDLLPIAEPER